MAEYGYDEISERIRRMLAKDPNPKTGWIPLLTADDLLQFISGVLPDADGSTPALCRLCGMEPLSGLSRQALDRVLAQMCRDDLLLTRRIEFGPSIRPRIQSVFAWHASVDHPGYAKWEGNRERVAGALERAAAKGKALLRRHGDG